MGAFHPSAVVHIAVPDSMFVYFTPCHKCEGEMETSGVSEGGAGGGIIPTPRLAVCNGLLQILGS